MKTREQAEMLRNIVDAMFMNVNNTQIKNGTGKMFLHKIEPFEDKDPEDENKVVRAGWSFSVTLSEPGYGSRMLQTIPFVKPDIGIDRFAFEVQVYSTILAIFAENTLLSWDILGKQLNTDKELQEAAKETLK